MENEWKEESGSMEAKKDLANQDKGDTNSLKWKLSTTHRLESLIPLSNPHILLPSFSSLELIF